jgi:hypothetical protein
MREHAETVRFGLRLPKQLYEYLTNKAMEHNRSINSEIIARLNPQLSTLLNVRVHEALRLVIEAYIRLLSESKDPSSHKEIVDKLSQYMVEVPQEVSDESMSRDLRMIRGENALE